MKGPVATAPLPDSQRHIASLDGVRGVAISLVLIVHLFWINPDTGIRFFDFVSKFRAAGWVGVDLFFALSGFLITGILFDTLNSDHFFKNFYARRVLRIFPLYYGIILALFVVLHPSTFSIGRPLYLLLVYLQNTPLWWNGGGSALALELTNHLWSLAVEEQFYLVWPVIIFLVRDRRKLLWTALLLAATAPITRMLLLQHGASLDATYKLTICRADSLLSGAWLALILRGNLRAAVLRFALPVFALSLLICGVIAWRTGNFDWQVNPAINSYGYTVIAIGSTAFIAMSLRASSFTAKTMSLTPLRFLGKYSYGIYVFHHIVGGCIDLDIAPLLHAHMQSRLLFRLLTSIGTFIITILVAWVSFNFYEQRFLKLKKYFKDSPRRADTEVIPVARASTV